MIHLIDSQTTETSYLLPHVEGILGSYQVPYRVWEPTGPGGNYRRQVEPLGLCLENLRPCDTVVLLDAFNPAILNEEFQSHAQVMGVKTFGFLHDATSAPGSRFSGKTWETQVEQALVSALDAVWVATDHLMQALPFKNTILGFPAGTREPQPFRPLTQKPSVLWPHEAGGAGYSLFLDLAKALHESYTFVAFGQQPSNKYVTYVDGQAQDVYGYVHYVLSANRCTFSPDVIEAVSSGCRPVLVNAGCYPELFEKFYTFDSPTVKSVADALQRIGHREFNRGILDTVIGRASDFTGSFLQAVAPHQINKAHHRAGFSMCKYRR